MPDVRFRLMKYRDFEFGEVELKRISDRTAKQLAMIGIAGALLVILILGLVYVVWVA